MTLKSTTGQLLRNAQQLVLIPAVLRTRGSAVCNVPVVAGLCLPKGRLSNSDCGHVEGFDQATPVQIDVLNRWHDGSVRWMLASFIAPDASCVGRELGIVATEQSDSSVRQQSYQNPGTDILTTIKLVGSQIHIITRNLDMDLPTEHTLRLSPLISDAAGEQLSLQFDGVREEVRGSVRQVFVVSSRVQALPAVTLQFRLTHWVSTGLLHVETRIRNTQRARHAGGLWDLGDTGSFQFRHLEVSVHSNNIAASAQTRWRAERDQISRDTSGSVFIRQFGSGDRFWNSPNHVSASESVPVAARGYEAFSDTGTLRGYRAEPAMVACGEGASLAMAIPEFWQNFPGSVGAAMGTLEFGMFPELPGVVHELQGGEQKTQSFWLSTAPECCDLSNLDWVCDPPRLMQSAVSIHAACVLPWFCPTGGVENQAAPAAERFAQYLMNSTSGRFSLESRRAAIDEYGWRNFGDIPADHEQTHYAGHNTIVSHYNNQFDMIFGGILQLSATADPLWFAWLDPLARHVMDIDIYHTNADRAAFNGGLFWHTDHYVDARTCTHRTYSCHNQKPGQPYGGGPSCEHNYTTGLLHYHFLTGSPEARESVLTLADWVIRMDDGRNTVFGLLDNGPTGAASATVFEDFHGPGRGAGNSINALLDGWLLTGSEHYLAKLEELIRRCVHPFQNLDDLHLLDAEGHWSYTVFLNSLGRYLLAKRDAELFDPMYRYARDVMQTYGRWMAENEGRTLDHPERLQYPTEAWAAQDFRKANVLRIAASCEDDMSQAEKMRAKADQISEGAWTDFAAFGESSRTARCLSIMMTEGPRDIFHRTSATELVPSCDAVCGETSWTMFVPQKQRVRRLIRSPASLLKACISALNFNRILQTWDALKKQM